MKKILRSPIVWIISMESILCVLMYAFGFRITYAPQLVNSWEAISACAGWAGVIASTVAILVAVRIPKIIADRQDKIALFEKRHEVYKVLGDCFAFAYLLENTDISDKMCRDVFHVTFNDNVKLNEKITWLDQMRTYSTVQNKLKMAEHLFGQEIGKEVTLLLANLLLLIQVEDEQEDPKKQQLLYIKQANKIQEEYETKIKNLLAL